MESAAPDDQGAEDDEQNERKIMLVLKKTKNQLRLSSPNNVDENLVPVLSSDMVSCIY